MGLKREEILRKIPIDELHSFKNHPYKVHMDDSIQELALSIEKYGILCPAIARPRAGGGYELISGHRRRTACELVDKKTMPVIVRELNDDEATILMVDSNLQREDLLPSERAFAYKMKIEALKHQGIREKSTSDQVGQKSWAVEQLAESVDISKTQVQRYIRLTYLIPEFLGMVDQKKISFNPAVELSYLKKDEQKMFLEAIDYEQTIPTVSQAQRIKKLSQEGILTAESLYAVLSEDKSGDIDRITIKNDVLKKYFPKSYTPKQMESTIVKLLEQWQKKRNRSQSL